MCILVFNRNMFICVYVRACCFGMYEFSILKNIELKYIKHYHYWKIIKIDDIYHDNEISL